MEEDGLKQEYIKQLSYTWNALERYLGEHNLTFNRETAFTFLSDQYAIHADENFAKLRSIDKQRKLGIAQAIMEHQKIIILDEPYNALDFNTNKEITKVLIELKQEGRTILLTGHQQEYLNELCCKMYCIENGNLLVLDEKKRKSIFQYRYD